MLIFNSNTVQFKVSLPSNVLVGASIVPLAYYDLAKLQIVIDICSELQNPRYTCVGFCMDDHGQLRGAYDA